MGRVAVTLCSACVATVLAAAASAATPQDESFEAIAPLVAEGRLSEALDRANAFTDPVLRHQSRLHVLYHAGDLPGALSAGLAGLREAEADLWLLHQSAEIARSLGATELVEDLSARLSRVVAAGLPEGADAEGWSSVADGFAVAAKDLRGKQDRRSASLSRARVTVLCAGAVSLVALTWLARSS